MKTILITAGGTDIPIDAVRHISNMSSGKFGSKLASTALLQGFKVILVRHASCKSPNELLIDLKEVVELQVTKGVRIQPYLKNLREYTFKTYTDYANVTANAIIQHTPDIIVAAAAVSDFTVDRIEGADSKTSGKLSSSGDLIMYLKPVPKVLPTFKRLAPNAHIIGFKLLVNCSQAELQLAAEKTMEAGNCSMVAGNDLTNIRKGQRQFTLFFPNGSTKQISNSSNLYEEFLQAVMLLK